MAPRKNAAAKMGVNKWDEELANMASAAVATEEATLTGGSFISTKGGVFSLGGAEIGESMQVIILDHVLENHFYNKKFRPDTPTSPVCFAFGRKEEELEPHEKCESAQHPQCKGCPMNEWESADTGRGKACKNIRRMALITADSLDDIENADVKLLKIPVTSVKGWAGYVQSLFKTFKIPTLAAVTEILIEGDEDTQFKVKFKLVEKITDGDQLAALLKKRSEIEDTLLTPYAPNTEEEEPRGRMRGAKAPAKTNAKIAGGRGRR